MLVTSLKSGFLYFSLVLVAHIGIGCICLVKRLVFCPFNYPFVYHFYCLSTVLGQDQLCPLELHTIMVPYGTSVGVLRGHGSLNYPLKSRYGTGI